MSYDVNCARCQAVTGACIDCGGCFLKHCECDPCQHGHARAQINDCPACRPTTKELTDQEMEEFAAMKLEQDKAEAIASLTEEQQNRLDDILGRASGLQPGEGDRDEK